MNELNQSSFESESLIRELSKFGFLSLLFEHAVSDDIIAKLVDCNNQIILVSGKKAVVDSEVEISKLHHVLQVLNQSLISDAHCYYFIHVVFLDHLIFFGSWVFLFLVLNNFFMFLFFNFNLFNFKDLVFNWNVILNK